MAKSDLHFLNCYKIRDRPFNLKGGGGGEGYVFFLRKYSDNVAEKNILILVEEKKIIWFRVFVILPNVNFWKRNSRFEAKKKF